MMLNLLCKIFLGSIVYIIEYARLAGGNIYGLSDSCDIITYNSGNSL